MNPPDVRGRDSEHGKARGAGIFPDFPYLQEMYEEICPNTPQSTDQSERHRARRVLPRFSTTFRVEVAGSALMVSAPPRPGQGTFHIARKRKKQSCEQMTHFRNRERKQGKYQWVRVRHDDHERMCLFPSDDPSKIGSRQHAERDMAIPSQETAHFV